MIARFYKLRRPEMARAATPDYRLTEKTFKAYLRFFNTMSEGMFSATLVTDNGQGYSLVLHQGGVSPKIRLALVSDPTDPSCKASDSWGVRDIIQEVLTFPELTKVTIDRTLQGSLGCVRLVIEEGVVVAAYFHNGELWP